MKTNTQAHTKKEYLIFNYYKMEKNLYFSKSNQGFKINKIIIIITIMYITLNIKSLTTTFLKAKQVKNKNIL